MRLHPLTLTTIVVLILAAIPVASHAIDATVTVNGVSVSVPPTNLCAAPPGGLDTSNGNACLDISGTYGPVTILAGQVVALRQDNNQIVLQGAVIGNNDAVNPATVGIAYGHLFFSTEGSPIDTSRVRFYGVSLSGNFFRPPFNLAANDNVIMTGLVRYSFSESGTTRSITGESPLNYAVPANVDVSFNNYGPQTPQQANNQFACGEGCLSQERLESVVTTILAATDFNVLPGSAHTVGATTQAARDSVLAAFTAKIDVDLKRSEEREEEEGEGQIRVTLFGSPVFDVLPCAESASCSGVDYATVVFGPGHAPVRGRPHFRDVNGDGILDAVLKFEADEAKLACSDKTATLSGAVITGGSARPFSASDIIPPCEREHEEHHGHDVHDEG